MTDVTCITCGKSGDLNAAAEWHPFQHPLKTSHDQEIPNIFKKPDPSLGRQNSAPAEVQVLQSSMPFDPVLRQALIAKGILTPVDLRDAEAAIAAVTGMTLQGVRDVPSTDDRR